MFFGGAASNVCPRCKELIHGLACANCAAKASQAAVLERQREAMPQILDGTFALTLGRVNNSAHAHIQLIGDPLHAWCGEAMNRAQRWERMFEKLDDTISLCKRCRARLHLMAAETRVT